MSTFVSNFPQARIMSIRNIKHINIAEFNSLFSMCVSHSHPLSVSDLDDHSNSSLFTALDTLAPIKTCTVSFYLGLLHVHSMVHLRTPPTQNTWSTCQENWTNCSPSNVILIIMSEPFRGKMKQICQQTWKNMSAPSNITDWSWSTFPECQ